MIVKPVLPVVTRLIAVLLPVLADLVAALLPILTHLAPVARRRLAGTLAAGQPIMEGIPALLGRPAGAWPAVAEARQRARAVAHAVGEAGAR